MYISYSDILESVAAPPKWWLYGVPRFSAFGPGDVCVYAREVALVQTECQGCRTRYDVGVTGSLRPKLAFYNALQVGDPPNACGLAGCSGRSMLSEELEVLEFWRRNGSFKWERDQSWERRLADYEGVAPWPEVSKSYLVVRDHSFTWYDAQESGDTETMRDLLESVSCELVDEVIEMLELERRILDAQMKRST